MTIRKPINKIISALKEQPGVTMLAEFREKYSAFQMLVATVMSARTKDSTTIPLCHVMFQTLKTTEDFIAIPVEKLEKLLFPIGFYRVKARNIKKLSVMLKEKFNGAVPKTMDELLSLPGVGRKTANCVLAYAFDIPAIPVDIHVHRISNRIGIVNTDTPEETESVLVATIPKKYWLDINEVFVLHGQNICKPRNPSCNICPISQWCDYYHTMYSRKKVSFP
jgi:endonuclease III